MPTKQQIEALYQRYLSNDISEQELQEFLQLMHTDELTISNLMDGTWQQMFDSSAELPEVTGTSQAKVIPLYKRTWYRVAAAAIIVLILSVGGYFYFNQNTAPQPQDNIVKNDIKPGGNKAILTLADGTQIVLDSAANGAITQQGNTKIIKLDSGQLAYNVTGTSAETLYNTISTPKGGQYQIVLPDGSKVWLNAASSLRFPTSFSKERNVELTGEGYFEVAALTSKGGQKIPFIVSVNEMKVEVLGTQFNINSYSDEVAIKTTLLEGSVKVTNASASKVIRPGQQAVLNNGQLTAKNVDVSEAVAWKEGRFIFQGNDIRSVMRQLARWYDVEVRYEGDITNDEFVGDLTRSRYENISKILETLERTTVVSFEINKKVITVKPYKK